MRSKVTITGNSAWWLLASITLTLAPHAAHLPIWLSLLCAVLLLWQGVTRLRPALQHDRRPVARLWILIVALISIALVVWEFGHFFGKDPGVAALAILLCLKQLEARSARDVRAAVLLSYFLQVGLFFYYQSIPVAALALCGVLISTATLLSLSDTETAPRRQLAHAGLMLLQALPLLLILFLAFPRVQGPLWGLPSDAFSGTTGLSDTMSPGAISDLSESYAIALRAVFDGPLPPPSQRYWRGPVLSSFDGRTWRSESTAYQSLPPYEVSGRSYSYTITLEPHNRPWLLAMDFPGSAPQDARYALDYHLRAIAPVRQRRLVALTSYPETATGRNLPDAVQRLNLALPRGFNPETLQRVSALLEGDPEPAVRVERILAMMRSQDLVYTLRPPRLGNHSVDEFLFSTRAGFCEHFASAFVFMARAAGVPARVVTGYQGGEVNPIDGSLVVRQSDAHAWAEVWLAGRGWIRVDPTAIVAPDRIELGLAASLPEGAFRPFMLRESAEWMRDALRRWEAVANAWNLWVLGYDPDRQRQFFDRLGLSEPDWRKLTIVMVAGAATVVALLLGWATWRRRNTDPLVRAWSTYCNRLARRGCARQPWEGPLQYAGRAALVLPDHARSIQEIAAHYAELRYGPTDAGHARRVQAFCNRIRSFHPR
ncbi:MAG: DUF3488 and DUF4129 domain-containing transglutaminase family protein [Rhodocyclaceae bacterium]